MTTTDTLKSIAKTQAQNALGRELARREAERRRKSESRFGHAGASIPDTHMSTTERYDFLLAAYDAALDNDGEVPEGFAHEWANAR
jgi:hypothetical protein